MTGAAQRLPALTPEELANPYTRISFDGLELQLWQVAHLYGVTHDVPGAFTRIGASAGDFRALNLRRRERGTTSSNIPAPVTARPVAGDRPSGNSSIFAASSTARGQARQPETLERDCDDLGTSTHDLLRLIDELVEEAWSEELEEDEEVVDHTAAASIVAPLRTHLNARWTPSHPLPLWADSSYPAPSHPPPNRPLPALPHQPAGSRRHDEGHKQTLAVPDSTARSRRLQELPEQTDFDRDIDLDSDRTITPTASRQQLHAATTQQAQKAFMPTSRATAEQPAPSRARGKAVQQNATVPRARDVSTPTSQAAVERPAPVPSGAGRAASTSILRNRDSGHNLRRQQSAGLTEPWPKLPVAVLPHPLPSFLQNPPSFLQHPPEFLQHPPQDQHAGRSSEAPPRPSRARSSSGLGAAASRPVTPTPDDEMAPTSRWSPDSSPEESRLKRVKRVLSFAKLRARKSSVFQRQTESQADEPSASAGKRTSGSSGRSSNKGGV